MQPLLKKQDKLPFSVIGMAFEKNVAPLIRRMRAAGMDIDEEFLDRIMRFPTHKNIKGLWGSKFLPESSRHFEFI